MVNGPGRWFVDPAQDHAIGCATRATTLRREFPCGQRVDDREGVRESLGAACLGGRNETRTAPSRDFYARDQRPSARGQPDRTASAKHRGCASSNAGAGGYGRHDTRLAVEPARYRCDHARLTTSSCSDKPGLIVICRYPFAQLEPGIDDSRRHRSDGAAAATSGKSAPGARPHLCVEPGPLVMGRRAICLETRQLCRAANNGCALDTGILATGPRRLGLDRR
jgi:hypothetical protein